jgi:hypothetical protein
LIPGKLFLQSLKPVVFTKTGITAFATAGAGFTGMTDPLPYIQMVLSVGTRMAGFTGVMGQLLSIQMVLNTGAGMASVTGITDQLLSIQMVLRNGTGLDRECQPRPP